MSPTPNPAAAKRRAAQPGSKVPANVKQPGDHQPAKSDVQEPQDVEVEWNGHTYVVLAESQDDAELLEHLTDQNHVGALMSMLGRPGWAEYKANERDPETGRVTNEGAARFLAHIMETLKRKN